MVKIREEINHIEDYYYIQKYRFEDRFDMAMACSWPE
ncbi:MAG TPA: histidine kinase [Clostridiales bacterium]|nr:histidine kinase [Clostridiales bacterium]